MLLPKDNEKDLAEIPEDVSAKLEFRLVENMNEVLAAALVEPVPNLDLGQKREEKKELNDRGGESVTH